MTTSSELRREASARPIALSARVRGARADLAPAGLVVADLAALTTVVVTAAWSVATPLAVATGLSLLVLVLAATVDAVEHRLPNRLVAAAAVPPVAAACIALVATTGPILGLVTGAALLGGPLFIVHLASPDGMGFGDVKAGSVLGAALGIIHVPLALFALLAACVVTVIAALATGRRAVAFGPGLVGGAVVVLVVGRLLGVEVTAWN